ncbi:MAG: hypothetical protein V4696_09555 [Pseudomonadota bacterium]
MKPLGEFPNPRPPVANRGGGPWFALADHIQLRDADLQDGLLPVTLVREIPEAMRPWRIDISGASDQSAIATDAVGSGKESTVEAEAHAA